MAINASFFPAEDGNRVAQLMKADLVAVDSQTFSFTAEGRLDAYAYPCRLDVTMKRDGEILAWQET